MKNENFFSIVLDSSKLLPVEAVFHLTITYWKRFITFNYNILKTFYFKFFSVSGIYYLNYGEVNFLKTKHILASEHQFFKFWENFLKWKQLSRIVEKYFWMFLTQLAQKDFLPSGNGIYTISLLTERSISTKYFIAPNGVGFFG